MEFYPKGARGRDLSGRTDATDWDRHPRGVFCQLFEQPVRFDRGGSTMVVNLIQYYKIVLLFVLLKEWLVNFKLWQMFSVLESPSGSDTLVE